MLNIVPLSCKQIIKADEKLLTARTAVLAMKQSETLAWCRTFGGAANGQIPSLFAAAPLCAPVL